MNNVGSCWCWFAEKSLDVVTSTFKSERRLPECEKQLFLSHFQGSCVELACKSSQRVLWPRKVELFSSRHDLTMGLHKF
jgi:hypothetical protein